MSHDNKNGPKMKRSPKLDPQPRHKNKHRPKARSKTGLIHPQHPRSSSTTEKRSTSSPSSGDGRGNTRKKDKRGNLIEVENLYKQAQDLLQPPISQDKFRKLLEIKRQVQSVLPGAASATGPHAHAYRESEQKAVVPKNPLQMNQKERTKRAAASASSSAPPSSSAPYVPYPSISDPSFDYVIPKKKEFALGAYPPVDTRQGIEALWNDKCKKNEFILTPNQHVLKNFVSPTTPYNGLLLFHGVGTGKTCAAVTIAEQFPDKKVLVLVQPGLQTNFRDHVFDFKKLTLTDTGVVDVAKASEQCTGMRYLNDVPDAELSSKYEVMKRIERAIRARYTFKGTQVFAKEVNRVIEESPVGWEERLRLKYSNHVIVVDEAHHLRVNLKDEERKAVTPAIRKVLKFAEGVKLLMLTATPMFNDANDVIELLNLLLMNDKRRPLHQNEVFDKSGNLKEPDGTRALTDACRGYVSYLRGDDPFSFPLRLNPANTNDSKALKPDSPEQPTLNLRGQPITTADRFRHTVLCASDMSSLQRRIYAHMDRLLKEASRAAVAATAISKATPNVLERTNKKAAASPRREKGKPHVQRHSDRPRPVDGDEVTDDTTPFSEPDSVYDVVDEMDEASEPESGRQQGNIASTFVYGMGVSNIVYPTPADAGARLDRLDDDSAAAMRMVHGRTGFNNNFVSVPGRGLRVKYADPTRQFLAPPSLGLYAPKMKTIVDRILNSEGIIFVYSRFLDSGIVPLAIALEHAGLSRYGQNDILAEGSARAKPPKQGWTYVAITARKHDLSMNKDEEVAAARSDDNADGSKVKVILGSDNASEGLDFKNIREVHVLDPWYHFNKTEQIVGRAARNCSHAGLPVDKRNVTVFLHVTRIRGSPRETIDIRAYRIAELKQRRIMKVESVIVANSVDCNLNKHTQFYDPKLLNLRIDVKTSQGRVLPNYPIGDRYPRQRVRCSTDVEVAPPFDASTYDPVTQAAGIHSCKAVFAKMFTRRHFFTFDEIQAECKAVYPTISDDAVMIAVQEVIDDHTPVKNPRGIVGYVIYASDKYIFQSRDAVDERDGLYDSSRTGDGQLALSEAPKYVAFRAADASSSTSRANLPSRWHAKAQQQKLPSHQATSDTKETKASSEKRSLRVTDGAPDDSPATLPNTPATLTLLSIDLVFDTAREMQDRFGLGPAYESPVIDYIIDRMNRSALLRVLNRIVPRALRRHKRPRGQRTAVRPRAASEDDAENAEEDKILASLDRGNVIWRAPPNDAFYMYDYFRDGYLCFSGEEFTPCEGPALARAESTDPGKLKAEMIDYRQLKGYVLHPTVNNERDKARPALFKLLGVSAESSGCVCHQTSSIRVDDLVGMIETESPETMHAIQSIDNKGVDPSDENGKTQRRRIRNEKRGRGKKILDKRQLCTLYELVLRCNAPAKFLRPALSSRVFRQKGKRMAHSTTSDDTPARTGPSPFSS